MSLMVSLSGVRGIVGVSLTPEIIIKYASAFGEYCQGGPIVIGRDGRITGKIIGHLVSSTLLSMGCDVTAIGICPTPTVQVAIEKTKAKGGISITASHNPIEWNGMKFLSSTGMFLDKEENSDLMEIAESYTRIYAAWDKLGNYSLDSTLIDRHLKDIITLPFLKIEQIRERKLKVVVDCINSSGAVIVPPLLCSLGCDVIEMNCDLSGIFAHTPEPLPQNLKDLALRVRAEKADLGIAVDPDADRLVLIDELGEPIGEEYTIVLATQFILGLKGHSESIRKTVVVNLSTTRAVDDIADDFGAEVIRTPVGEINVAKKMKEIRAAVGGEGSGGVIVPDVHYGRDAVVGIALIFQHLINSGKTLSELKRSLPQYVITKHKFDVEKRNPEQILSELALQYEKVGKINRDDGLKIDFEDCWIHLRKSNTEPIVRLIAEARSWDRAESLIEEFKSAISKFQSV